ncbi:MAG: hypothetical protein LJE97_02020 [Betaproteobacteria bacterium]|nr:hypothetical protein [Betaproteobacteria bacterium]
MRPRVLAWAFALGVAVFATTAETADVMYSWREPGTGQLKIASVPPPWLRNPDTASRGPRVNVFKDGKVVPPERIGPGGKILEPPPPKPGETPPGDAEKQPELPDVLAKRNAAMERLETQALLVGPAAANETFFTTLDRYLELCTQADEIDPAGATARNAERERSMQRVKANIESVLRQPEPRTAFQNEATRWFSEKAQLAAQKIVRCVRDGYC